MAEEKFLVNLLLRRIDEVQKHHVWIERSALSSYEQLKFFLAIIYDEEIMNSEIKYYDEDEDLITISSEEEFAEFAKILRRRTSCGLITNLEVWLLTTGKRGNNSQEQVLEQEEVITNLAEVMAQQANPTLAQQFPRSIAPQNISEWRAEIVEQIKNEVLAEMRASPMTPGSQTDGGAVGRTLGTTTVFEGASIPDIAAGCAPSQETQADSTSAEEGCQKLASKLTKKLQKLEQKKKDLLEKELRVKQLRKHDKLLASPEIWSGIVTKCNSRLVTNVIVGSTFKHTWVITNDGTMTWKDVKLRHTWSTPGLMPLVNSMRCKNLKPKEEDRITVKFVAPDRVTPFISYWHLYYYDDPQWVQFAHYIAVSGTTSLLSVIKSEPNKKTSETTKTLKRSHERLASADIAETMAKEAARIAKETATKKSDKDTNTQQQGTFEQEEPTVGRESIERMDTGVGENDENAGSDEEFEILNNEEDTTCDPCLSNDTEEVVGQIASDKEEEVKNPTNNSTTDANAKSHASDMKALRKSFERNLEMFSNSVSSQVPQASNPFSINPKSVKEMTEEKKSHDVIRQEVCQSPQAANESASQRVKTTARPPVLSENLSQGFNANASQGLNTNVPRGFNLSAPLGFNANAMQGFNTNVPQGFNSSAPLGFNASSPQGFNGAPQGFNASARQGFNPGAPQGFNLSAAQGFIGAPQGFNASARQGFNPGAPQGFNTSSPLAVNHQGWYAVVPPVLIGNPPQYYPGTPLVQQGLNARPSQGFNTMAPQSVNAAQNQRGVLSAEVPSSFNFSRPQSASKRTLEPTKVKETQSEPALRKVSSTHLVENPTVEPQVNEQPKASGNDQECKTLTDNNLVGVPMKESSNVHILPQGLLEGAVNVATSAYSTACNALSNLRSREDDPLKEFDLLFENNLALLVDMGFLNVERNARLLKRFNNDINEVISELFSNPALQDMD